MWRKTPLTRLSSSEHFTSQECFGSDDLASQLLPLSTSTSLSTASSDNIALLVKGKPLTTVIQLLADALLHQQGQLQRSREAAEVQAKQAEVLFSDYRDALGKVKDDLHFSHRPFFLTTAAAAVSSSPSSSLEREQSARQPQKTALHRQTSVDTLADAVRLTYTQIQQLRRIVLRNSADSLCDKVKQKQRRAFFSWWARRGARRVRATALELSLQRSLLATFYAQWKRRTDSDGRQQLLRRGRHLRAVIGRSQKAVLSVYLRKWRLFVTTSSTQAAQLRLYQLRIARLWSTSGPSVTACKQRFFAVWRAWLTIRKAERHHAAASALLETQHADERQLHLLRSSFTNWHEKTQQRRLARLYHRLSRLMEMQTMQSVLRRFYRSWAAKAERAWRLHRLEVLVADQHKRRVTALARRYFNELRYFRREQQFQRMMRGVEASLLTLADRVGGIEDVVLAQNKPHIAVATAPPRQLFLSSPHTQVAQSPQQRMVMQEDKTAPQEPWNPATDDDDLLARVEELLSRPRSSTSY